MASGKRAWRASEALAAWLLEELGFRVVEFHHRITVEGVDVGEIDIVAERKGQLYAVEVKAGQADVGAIRQAYVNAVAAGMKPLVVARGADDAARRLAEKLGVELLVSSDIVYAGSDEVREIVREAVAEALLGLAQTLYSCNVIDERDEETLRAVAESPSIGEAAERLGLPLGELARRLDELRRRGVLPREKGWKSLRAAAMLALICRKLGGGVPRP